MRKALLNIDDLDLLKEVKPVLKKHIEHIETLLHYPNKVEEEFLAPPLNQLSRPLYYPNKENLLLAFYILRYSDITQFVEEHCGMSGNNRIFLNTVKADLKKYQEEIRKIERRLNQ